MDIVNVEDRSLVAVVMKSNSPSVQSDVLSWPSVLKVLSKNKGLTACYPKHTDS